MHESGQVLSVVNRVHCELYAVEATEMLVSRIPKAKSNAEFLMGMSMA